VGKSDELANLIIRNRLYQSCLSMSMINFQMRSFSHSRRFILASNVALFLS
jgi:hypothetical protein